MSDNKWEFKQDTIKIGDKYKSLQQLQTHIVIDLIGMVGLLAVAGLLFNFGWWPLSIILLVDAGILLVLARGYLTARNALKDFLNKKVEAFDEVRATQEAEADVGEQIEESQQEPVVEQVEEEPQEEEKVEEPVSEPEEELAEDTVEEPENDESIDEIIDELMKNAYPEKTGEEEEEPVEELPKIEERELAVDLSYLLAWIKDEKRTNIPSVNSTERMPKGSKVHLGLRLKNKNLGAGKISLFTNTKGLKYYDFNKDAQFSIDNQLSEENKYQEFLNSGIVVDLKDNNEYTLVDFNLELDTSEKLFQIKVMINDFVGGKEFSLIIKKEGNYVEPEYYNVTFLNADGTLISENSVMEGSSIKLPALDKDEYFYDNAQGEGESYDLVELENINRDYKLYACSNKIVRTVNIYCGDVLFETYKVNSLETVNIKLPMLKGFDFVDFNTRPDGTGTSYLPYFTVEDDLDLYAQFEPREYKVDIFDQDKIVYSGFAKFGEYLDVNLNTFKEGKKFLGVCKTDEENSEVYPINEIEVNGDTSLYMAYETQTFTIKFYSQNSLFDEATVSYGANFIIEKIPERVGYRFNSYNTNTNGDGQEFTRVISEVKNDLSLYAQFTVLEFRVNYVDGDRLIKSIACKYGETLRLEPLQAKEGKEFVGYSPSNESKDIISDNQIVIVSDTNLHAMYSDQLLNINYYDQDKLIGSDKLVYGGDLSYNVIPDRVGYDFIGYGLDPNSDEVNKNIIRNVKENTNLYAKFKKKEFIVNYFVDNKIIESRTAKYQENVKLINVDEKTGSKFVGFSINPNHTNERIYKDEYPCIESDVNLYAVFSTNNYQVDLYDDETLINSYQVEFMKDLVIKDVVNKDGYTFKSFNTKKDGSGIEINNILTNVHEDTKLYAIYAINKYVVNFIVDNKIINSQQVAYNATVKFDFATPIKEGKEFVEFNTNLDGTGTSYKDEIESVHDNLNLFGIYQLKTLKINIYDDEDLIDVLSCKYGESADLPLAKHKDGLTFVGYTPTNVGNAAIFNDVVNNVTGDMNLYTKYQTQVLYVNLINDDRIIDTKKIEYGSDVELIDTIEKEGYTLSGFNTKIDGSGESFKGIIRNVTSDMNLFATFELNKYSVKVYDDSALIDTYYVKHGTDLRLNDAVQKEGYSFKEYNSNLEGKGITYGNTIYEVTGDMNLYAIYTPLVYKVEFIDDEEVIDTQLVEFNKDAKISIYPEKEGYDLTGFIDYSDNITYFSTVNNVKKNMKLFSKYNKKVYTVNFYKDDQILTSCLVEHGSSAICDSNDYEKEGNDFLGFNTSMDGNGINYQLQIDKVTEDMNLYAKYRVHTFEINYFDGKENIGKQVVRYNDDVPIIFNQSKEGFDFVGYNTSPLGTGLNYYTLINNVKSNMDLFAIFVKKEYTVSYMVDGVVIETQSVKFGEDARVIPDPSKEGYRFMRWDGSLKNIKSNVVVNAEFEQSLLNYTQRNAVNNSNETIEKKHKDIVNNLKQELAVNHVVLNDDLLNETIQETLSHPNIANGEMSVSSAVALGVGIALMKNRTVHSMNNYPS